MWLVALALVAGFVALFGHKRVGLYTKVYTLTVLAMFMLPYGGIYRYLPNAVYYVPALSFPVLTFFLFFRKKPPARVAFYTVNLSALLVIVYAFALALYFLNHYMGPSFGEDGSPSLLISQRWKLVFIWFVLPFDLVSLLIFLAGYWSNRGRAR